MKKVIVKVQLALASSKGSAPALIYDKKRSFTAMVPVTKDMIKIMNGSPKAFFYAHFEGTNIMLDKIAAWQDW